MAKKIYFTSFKGGTGVTTCCIGIGRALAELGERTLIVDGDTKCGGATLMANCRDMQVYTLADYENGACRSKQAIIPHPQTSNLHIMPCTGLKDVQNAKKAVEDIDGLFDYILLDKISAEICDSAIIVTEPFLPSVKSADVCRSFLRDSGIRDLGLIVNKLSASMILNGETMTAREISALIRVELTAVIPEDLSVSADRWHGYTLKAFKTAAQYVTGASRNVTNVMRGHGGLNGYFKRKMRERI